MKLFIDSATYYLYLAIVDPQTDYIYTFTRYGKNDHSETLTNYLETFLKDNELKIEDITEIYVGRGPGSYTGLRIAGTVGKVFAYIKNLPFFSFSSLDLMVGKVFNQQGRFLTRIKAKKDYSYIKAYTIDTEIKIDVDDTFISDDELSQYKDYDIIEVNDELFQNPQILIRNILKYKLYRTEDKFTYVPNYLRSELS